MPFISFTESNSTYPVKVGTEIKALSQHYPDFPICFGCQQGQCGKCAIEIVEGEENVSPKTKQEIHTLTRCHLTNKRLACQCAVKKDIKIKG